MSHLHVPSSSTMRFKNILVVIKQTAYEEYSQLKLRGMAPKALRWKRLEQRYKAHKQCVTDLLSVLRQHSILNFSCVNRAELDRQHLADIDLLIAVGGDGTVLSAAHFLDHGTIPLLGINSDPNVRKEDRIVKKKQSDERRSHGALCMCTALDMKHKLEQVFAGDGHLTSRTRIRCKVKSTFSETLLVPALNDLLLANPSPAAVSRFRMGWLQLVQQDEQQELQSNDNNLKSLYGTITRFNGKAFDVTNSINVWSSGMWICTATGSTAAMAAAGGKPMQQLESRDLQYLIREHMIENVVDDDEKNQMTAEGMNNALVTSGEKLHVRWNSQRGRIFIDGSHLTHDLELGDEILIDNNAPPLKMYTRKEHIK